MRHRIENEELLVEIESLGVELKSLIDKKSNKEYMWCADPEYWNKTSPILFPFIGNCKNREMQYKGKKYPVSQHGFARDMEFELDSKEKDQLWFSLVYTEETLEIYPFKFKLSVGYVLEDRKLKVLWKVENLGEEVMYFSIGGHPAFNCPINEGDHRSDYYLEFENVPKIESRLINMENGLARNQLKTYMLEEGRLPITNDLFSNDALVIENNQVQQVALLTPDKKPYVTVKFDVPLFGVWSSVKKDTPLICIEPWYGRCDSEDFEGEISDREWQQELNTRQVFEKGYSIEV